MIKKVLIRSLFFALFLCSLFVFQQPLCANAGSLPAANGITASVAPKALPEAGKVLLTFSPAAATAHTLYYRTTSVDPTAPGEGESFDATGWTAITAASPIEVAATNGHYIEIVEVTQGDTPTITKWGKTGAAADGYTADFLPYVFVELIPGTESGTSKMYITDAPEDTTAYAILLNDSWENGCTYVGDPLPADAVAYTSGTQFTSRSGEYLHIYAVNEENRVLAVDYFQMGEDGTVNIFSGGDGTEAHPFQITNATQLAKIGDFYNRYERVPYYFILNNDIDLNISPYNTGAGWIPIYNFRGHFDGNYKTITNLKTNASERIVEKMRRDDPDGLFSNLYAGSIKNLAIINANISGYDYAGILAGTANKDVHIEQVYVSGTVSGKLYTGGLIGYIGSSLKTILNCYSVANVSGSGMVGGLAGVMERSSIINCYAAGTVSLVNPNNDPFYGDESPAYSSFIGGLVGADNPYEYEDDDNTFTSVYYDTQVSGQTDAIGKGTPQTTAEMKTQATFSGWDFTNVWAISTSVNNGYPYLKNLPPAKTTTGSSPSKNTTEVLVNGKTENLGKSQTTTEDGKKTTTVTLEQTLLDKKLETAGAKPVVTIPVTTGANVAVGQLNGQIVKNMEAKEAVLEIKTNNATYTLPAAQISIDDVSKELGETVGLKDINVQVKISEPPADAVKVVENAAEKGNFAIMVPAVEFTISCTHNDKTVAVSKFNAYVERTVAIPDGVDPAKITTGIVVDADGTTRHVPTQIVEIDGKYYAKINSLTNSTYTVIWNPIAFADVATHWAKASVNNMGSRMVVNGVGSGNYAPDNNITRAEFAAIIVRALGLSAGTGNTNFTDVASTAWYAGYVETAAEYGLITGYSNDKFAPNDQITREQAIAIIARAMKITKLNTTTLTEAEMTALLKTYKDAATVSSYAKNAVATCLQTGLVTGRTANTIVAQGSITRAEVAVIVERLLQKSELI